MLCVCIIKQAWDALQYKQMGMGCPAVRWTGHGRPYIWTWHGKPSIKLGLEGPRSTIKLGMGGLLQYYVNRLGTLAAVLSRKRIAWRDVIVWHVSFSLHDHARLPSACWLGLWLLWCAVTLTRGGAMPWHFLPREGSCACFYYCGMHGYSWWQTYSFSECGWERERERVLSLFLLLLGISIIIRHYH